MIKVIQKRRDVSAINEVEIFDRRSDLHCRLRRGPRPQPRGLETQLEFAEDRSPLPQRVPPWRRIVRAGQALVVAYELKAVRCAISPFADLSIHTTANGPQTADYEDKENLESLSFIAILRIYATPMRIPARNTSTPPTMTWNEAARNGVSI